MRWRQILRLKTKSLVIKEKKKRRLKKNFFFFKQFAICNTLSWNTNQVRVKEELLKCIATGTLRLFYFLFFHFFMRVRLHQFSKQRSRLRRQVLMGYSWTGGVKISGVKMRRREGWGDRCGEMTMDGWMDEWRGGDRHMRKEGRGRRRKGGEAGWVPLIIYDSLGFLSRPSSRALCLPLTFNLSENQRAWSLIIVSVCCRRQTLRWDQRFPDVHCVSPGSFKWKRGESTCVCDSRQVLSVSGKAGTEFVPSEKQQQQRQKSCWSANPFFYSGFVKGLLRLLFFNIDVSYLTLFLGNITHGLLSEADKYLLKVLLAVSKKAITKCWLQKNAPTRDIFVNTVKQICVL